MKKYIGIVLSLVLLLQGCGYTFYGRGGAIPHGGISKVFVKNFFNTSSEANVETLIRNALILKLIRGGIQIADSEETADAVITGSVRSVSISPLSLTATNVAALARIMMVLDAKLLRKSDASTLWEMAGFSKSGDYAVSTAIGGTTLTEAQKQEALTTLCGNVSDHLYSLMFAGF